MQSGSQQGCIAQSGSRLPQSREAAPRSTSSPRHHSSTLMRVISTCEAPGITISALSFAIAASMQQNLR